MNYRHSFHAGCFADVVKHVVLLLLVDYLQQKDKPLFMLDTHAGAGVYDLSGDEARRTGEAERGIGRVWARPPGGEPPGLAAYMELLTSVNRGRGKPLTRYPGSPAILARRLRAGDRLIANELHPESRQALETSLSGFPAARVTGEDGYQCLKSLMPPAERRGLILIDPPFEVRDEFSRMLAGMRDALRRFPQGVYALWYPLKRASEVAAFEEELIALAPGNWAILDVHIRAPEEEAFTGTGLAVLNPPWTLREHLEALRPALMEAMAEPDGVWLYRDHIV